MRASCTAINPTQARHSLKAAHLRCPVQPLVIQPRQKHQHIQRHRSGHTVVHAQGGSAGNGGSSSSSSHAGKAVLHDFCMTIPYSAIALLSGLMAAVLRVPAVGLQLAGAGLAVAMCSVLSLKSWKAGGSSTLYTLVSAGASGWIAHQMWQRVAASAAPVPSGILLALSAALAVFCVYNVLAGGNPPRASKAE